MSFNALYSCLLGCAIGDSVGIPFEGLSRRRVSKFARFPLRQSFLLGYGLGSDDTDHTVFIAQSLGRANDNPEAFAKIFAGKLKLWLFCLPAGIGQATLKGIIKLFLGFSPHKSGVFSAGNAPAMRSAIIGVYYANDQSLRNEFVRAATRITHTDPKAEYAARAVADIAANLTNGKWSGKPSIVELEKVLAITADSEWQQIVLKIINGCLAESLDEFLKSINCSKSVSGYVYHSVPLAIVVWFKNFGDFRATVEECIKAGGDTDTTAAIAGALAGITIGEEGIPADWRKGYADFANSKAFLRKLAASLNGETTEKISTNYLKLFLKGALFSLVVIFHVLRRFLPPY